MENGKKETKKKPHFVEITQPESQPWKTNIYFGVGNETGSHAHIVASGSAVIYFRDMNGSVVIDA